MDKRHIVSRAKFAERKADQRTARFACGHQRLAPHKAGAVQIHAGFQSRFQRVEGIIHLSAIAGHAGFQHEYIQHIRRAERHVLRIQRGDQLFFLRGGANKEEAVHAKAGHAAGHAAHAAHIGFHDQLALGRLHAQKTGGGRPQQEQQADFVFQIKNLHIAFGFAADVAQILFAAGAVENQPVAFGGGVQNLHRIHDAALIVEHGAETLLPHGQMAHIAAQQALHQCARIRAGQAHQRFMLHGKQTCAALNNMILVHGKRPSHRVDDNSNSAKTRG